MTTHTRKYTHARTHARWRERTRDAAGIVAMWQRLPYDFGKTQISTDESELCVPCELYATRLDGGNTLKRPDQPGSPDDLCLALA